MISFSESVFYGLTTGAIIGGFAFVIIFSFERAERQAINAVYDTVFQNCAIEIPVPTAIDFAGCAKQAEVISKEARDHL